MPKRNINRNRPEQDSLQALFEPAAIHKLSRLLTGKHAPPSSNSYARGHQYSQQGLTIGNTWLGSNDTSPPVPVPTPGESEYSGRTLFQLPVQGYIPGAEQATYNHPVGQLSLPVPPNNQQDYHFHSVTAPIPIPIDLFQGSSLSQEQGIFPAAELIPGDPPWPPQGQNLQLNEAQIYTQVTMSGPDNQKRPILATIAPQHPYSFIARELADTLGGDIIPCHPGYGHELTLHGAPMPEHVVFGLSIESQLGQPQIPRMAVSFIVYDSDWATTDVVLGAPILKKVSMPVGPALTFTQA